MQLCFNIKQNININKIDIKQGTNVDIEPERVNKLL